ncbi:MAG TPA: hypothetical protein VEU11_04735, partial [Terriglobales bacterium]|nr:hypothetical protein [Terriglobales bacterium]
GRFPHERGARAYITHWPGSWAQVACGNCLNGLPLSDSRAPSQMLRVHVPNISRAWPDITWFARYFLKQ